MQPAPRLQRAGIGCPGAAGAGRRLASTRGRYRGLRRAARGSDAARACWNFLLVMVNNQEHDPVLIRRAQAGDADAVAELHQRHAPVIFRYLYVRLCERATAEDLTKLSARLAPNAVQLKPGSEASFLVAFYEYPPDLKDFRVRVTVSPDDGSTAAR